MALKIAPINLILVISLVPLSALSVSAQTKADETKNTIISDSAFQKTLKDNPVVIADFYEKWCGACRMQAVIMDSIANEQKGKIVVLKILVDDNKNLTEKMLVSSYPTLLLYKNGKQVWRSEGIMPKYIIADAIKTK
jgi:thioredoxin 1